ncbi:diguanylate cyclase [Rheinheimera maricola]|uniref:diguanylate cyclase n=1 Tax=Rheinheimera maricola TaxID=2793282 RepID=A0ABS7X4M7_9GAMM|nr:diguanylate cyclase [Rheinheimera maricola]MBZ9610495.1 diguanylate cyclase [Rheinheimera maricola]
MQQRLCHLTTLALLSLCSLTAFANTPVSYEGKTLTYCVDPDWMPYEAIRDGTHVGISADYLALVAKKTGLEFSLLRTESWVQTLQLLQSGDCMLSPLLNRSATREQYLHFSQVYFRAPNVLVSLRQQPFLQTMENIGSRSLAVPEGYRLLEHIQRYYPQTPIVLVENETAGLHAVADGKADLFIGSLYSINRQIQQETLYQLKVAGWLGLEDELRFGVVTAHQPILTAINQALADITEAEHVAIYQKWSRIKVPEVVNYTLMWQLGAAALALILLLAAWNYRSRYFYLRLQEKNRQLEQTRTELEAAVQKLEFLSNHDPLTHLYNRNHFDNNLRAAQQRAAQAQQAFSLALIDIDLFKQINDTHGHTIGDAILRELAQILSTEVREQDQVTRWGGEEFVIFCQHTTLAEVKALCDRVAAAIKRHSFSHNINLTCSFGVAEQQDNEDLLHCFERADKALYQAKQAGRNQICIA